MTYEDLDLGEEYDDEHDLNFSASAPRTGTIPYSIVTIIRERESVWTAVELGRLLGFNGKHIYKLAKAGRMPSYRLGGAVRFDPHAVADWLEGTTTG